VIGDVGQSYQIEQQAAVAVEGKYSALGQSQRET
jgi:hypothetical protein